MTPRKVSDRYELRMGSTPGSTKLGLVGGATKLDVSKPKLLVATTAVPTTPGLSDALAGSDASGAPTATSSTRDTWVVDDLSLRRDYRWFRNFLGSYCTWTFTKT